MAEKFSYIPARLKSAVKGGFVTGAEDVMDDRLGMSQQRVNEALENGINALDSQGYEHAEATEQTTDVTDLLPVTGEKNKLYQVAFWDGEQYNTNAYAQYTWDGEQYKLMSVKNPGIDADPTAGSSKLVESEGVDKALADIHKGLKMLIGMQNVEITRGGKIDQSNETCDISAISSDSSWGYAIVPCSAGDKFTIVTAYSGAAYYRIYAFLDEPVSNVANVLERSAISFAPDNTVITAPADSAYLIINVNLNYPYLIYNGDNKNILTPSSDVVARKDGLTASDDISALSSGIYRKVSSVVPQNWPEELDSSLWWLVICFHDSSNYIAQVFLRGDSAVFRIKAAGTWGNLIPLDYRSFIQEAKKQVVEITGNDVCDGWQENKGYNTGGSTISTEPSSNSYLKCISVPCTPGEFFTITGIGLSNSNWRPYAFVDSSNNKIMEGTVATMVNTVIYAPAGAARLVVNLSKSDEGYLIKGQNVKATVGNVYEKSLSTWDEIAMYQVTGDVGETIHVYEHEGEPNPAFSHFILAVEEGQIYEVQARLTGSTTNVSHYIIYTDSEDVIVAKDFVNDGSRGNVFGKYITTVPVGATKMYVNSYAFIRNTENVSNTKASYLTFVNLQTQVDNINKLIEDIKNEIVDANLPSYYLDATGEDEKDYITKKIDTIRSIQNQIGTNNDSFIFITDYHLIHNQGNSIDLIKYLSARTGITKLIFGGDVAGSSTPASDAHNAWSALSKSADEYYSILGNHEWDDADAPDGSYSYTLGALGQFYLARHKKDAVSMDIDTQNYYIDNKVNKVRYYFLNCKANSVPTDGTIQWLGNSLAEVPSGYAVIVFMHYAYVDPSAKFCELGKGEHAYDSYNYYDFRYVNQILGAFNTHSSVTVSTYTFNYANTNGSVIGIFSGHMHHSYLYGKDDTFIKVKKVGDDVVVDLDGSTPKTGTNEEGVNVFAGSTDSLLDALDGIGSPVHPWFWSGDITVTYDGTATPADAAHQLVISGAEQVRRSEKTVYEQCFYIVNIDIDEKKVYITAIGGDHDWEFEY